jgi:hypothetical protein
MKIKTILLALLTLLVNNLLAQTNAQTEPSFSEQVIKTSDLILEGTVTSISYFRDTTATVRNYRFHNYLFDDKGVWFVKYEITIHKLFKGEKRSKVTLIDPCRNNMRISDDTLQVYFSYDRSSPFQGNLIVNSTCIFMLTKSFEPELPLFTNAYYFNYAQGCIGYYNLLMESILYIPEKGIVRKFETLDDLYKYLEKETKTKKIDITHKQFFVFNSADKLDSYKYKYNLYINDSLEQKLKSGRINQLNVDSFKGPPIYQPTKKELRILKRERIRKGEEAKIKSKKMLEKMKEDLNYYKKTGSLNKVDETLTYTFSNALYSKTVTGTTADVFLEYDIVVNTSDNNYLKSATIIINYNTSVFGSGIFNLGGLTVTRGNIISNTTNYDIFTPSDQTNNSSFGIVIDVSSLSTPRNILTKNTSIILFHVKMKVLNSGFGLMTNLSINNSLSSASFTNNNGSTPPTWIESFVIISTSTENHKAATPEITSLSKTSVIGGVGEVLEVNGRFFGAQKGTNGNIQFKAAESVPNINIGDFVSLNDYDFIWSDRKITVQVPSVVLYSSNKQVDLGSGPIRIYNDLSSTNSIVSTQNIEIKYTIVNFIVQNGVNITNKLRPGLLGTNNKSGIDFVVHQTVFNNQAAMKCIIAALKKWSCETGMNWNITKIVNSTTASNTENLISYGTSSMTKAMNTIITPRGCTNTSTNAYTDTDIEINPLKQWGYSISTKPSSPNEDFYGAILHELGHCIGLDHTVNLNGTYDLMYWTLNIPNSANNSPSIITNDDKDGANDIINYSSSINFGCFSNMVRNTPTCSQYATKVNIDDIYLSHKCPTISPLNPELIPLVSQGTKNYHYFWESYFGNVTSLDDYYIKRPRIVTYKQQSNCCIQTNRL